MSAKDKLHSIWKDIKEAFKSYAEHAVYNRGLFPVSRLI